MKTLDLNTIFQKVNKLNEKKSKKVEEILLHSTPRDFISEEIRNQTTLQFLEELREIQSEIDEIMSLTIEVETDLAKSILKLK